MYLLKQVVANVTATRVTNAVELDLEIFTLICKKRSHRTYEARRVVVSQGLGVTKSFEQRIGIHDNVLDVGNVLGITRYSSDVFHDELGSFGLTST